jgi:predicted phosphohydrolase
MSVWAISDPHLSFGVTNKSMEVFGPLWGGYAEKMAENWRKAISPDDLVLIPGDISWATQLEEAVPDLEWIDALPGTKLILRGNHDYWWTSTAKMAKIMPPSIHFIQNNVFNWHDITIGGARLWDSEEYSFEQYVQFVERPNRPPKVRTAEEIEKYQEEARKIFARELERLKLSLKQLNSKAHHRIALTHYPPIGADLHPSLVSALLEEYRIEICIFGHLHSLKPDARLFGEARGVRYLLTSCDYINFDPVRVL